MQNSRVGTDTSVDALSPKSETETNIKTKDDNWCVQHGMAAGKDSEAAWQVVNRSVIVPQSHH